MRINHLCAALAIFCLSISNLAYAQIVKTMSYNTHHSEQHDE